MSIEQVNNMLDKIKTDINKLDSKTDPPSPMGTHQINTNICIHAVMAMLLLSISTNEEVTFENLINYITINIRATRTLIYMLRLHENEINELFNTVYYYLKDIEYSYPHNKETIKNFAESFNGTEIEYNQAKFISDATYSIRNLNGSSDFGLQFKMFIAFITYKFFKVRNERFIYNNNKINKFKLYYDVLYYLILNAVNILNTASIIGGNKRQTKKRKLKRHKKQTGKRRY